RAGRLPDFRGEYQVVHGGAVVDGQRAGGGEQLDVAAADGRAAEGGGSERPVAAELDLAGAGGGDAAPGHGQRREGHQPRADAQGGRRVRDAHRGGQRARHIQGEVHDVRAGRTAVREVGKGNGVPADDVVGAPDGESVHDEAGHVIGVGAVRGNQREDEVVAV